MQIYEIFEYEVKGIRVTFHSDIIYYYPYRAFGGQNKIVYSQAL